MLRRVTRRGRHSSRRRAVDRHGGLACRRLLNALLAAPLVAACGAAPPPQPPTTTPSSEATVDGAASSTECETALLHARSVVAAHQAIATERADILELLEAELNELIETETVFVGFRRGLLVIQLPNLILFETGRATVSEEGRDTVTEVGRAIAQIDGRRFLVAGHTDDRPIRSEQYPSNWELSMARGFAVLRVLLEAGVSPENVGAAGFGEYDPVAPNDSDEQRADNRRTEILLIPNLQRLLGHRVPSYDDEMDYDDNH